VKVGVVAAKGRSGSGSSKRKKWKWGSGSSKRKKWKW